MLDAALAQVASGRYSSLHLLFPTTSRRASPIDRMITRRGVQFHWTNSAYTAFDDFLGALTHDKRKRSARAAQARRRRRHLRSQTGSEISAAD